MTALEIINETAAAYADPKRRAKDEADSNCEYVTKDGRKCALGRCMRNPAALLTLNDGTFHPGSLRDFGDRGWCISNGSTSWRSGEPFGDHMLLPQYRGHPPAFWSDLQKWHDDDVNFTDTGISERGQGRLDALRNKWEGGAL